MKKHTKRLQKTLLHTPKDAIVIGSGMNLLPSIIEMFDTVFIHSRTGMYVKDKKVVYRREMKTLYALSSVSAVFVDLEHIKALDLISPLYHNPGPEVIVEGKEVIGRDRSVALYAANYNCLVQGDKYHIWDKIK
jgi:hypothetical protein|tara:strand:+ start:12231 stop:12632 length:402 start_codon:yes stop_codon:yes gene_type:complete